MENPNCPFLNKKVECTSRCDGNELVKQDNAVGEFDTQRTARIRKHSINADDYLLRLIQDPNTRKLAERQTDLLNRAKEKCMYVHPALLGLINKD